MIEYSSSRLTSHAFSLRFLQIDQDGVNLKKENHLLSRIEKLPGWTRDYDDYQVNCFEVYALEIDKSVPLDEVPKDSTVWVLTFDAGREIPLFVPDEDFSVPAVPMIKSIVALVNEEIQNLKFIRVVEEKTFEHRTHSALTI